MTQEKLLFNVMSGPSKFDLMLSLFDGNKKPRRTVEFQLESARAPIVVAIIGVQQEDGSGESWNIEGYLVNYRHGFKVRGYYCSKDRKGYLTFEVPFHWRLEASMRHKVVSPEQEHEVEDYVDWLRGKGTGWPIPHANIYSPTHRG